MYAAGGGIDEAGQRVDVGACELLEGAVGQYLAHDGMFAAQGLEHLFAGGVLPALGLAGLLAELQFLEEHRAHLSRR